MINKEELRIGNHVSDIYTENLVMRVKSLGKKICTYGVSDFKCSYEKLVPVKITNEALIRCGFSQTYITDPQMPNAQSKWCLDNFQFFKYDEEDFFFFASFNSDITELRFVHHLQNLYFAHKGVDLDFFK